MLVEWPDYGMHLYLQPLKKVGPQGNIQVLSEEEEMLEEQKQQSASTTKSLMFIRHGPNTTHRESSRETCVLSYFAASIQPKVGKSIREGTGVRRRGAFGFIAHQDLALMPSDKPLFL